MSFGLPIQIIVYPASSEYSVREESDRMVWARNGLYASTYSVLYHNNTVCILLLVVHASYDKRRVPRVRKFYGVYCIRYIYDVITHDRPSLVGIQSNMSVLLPLSVFSSEETDVLKRVTVSLSCHKLSLPLSFCVCACVWRGCMFSKSCPMTSFVAIIIFSFVLALYCRFSERERESMSDIWRDHVLECGRRLIKCVVFCIHSWFRPLLCLWALLSSYVCFWFVVCSSVECSGRLSIIIEFSCTHKLRAIVLS